MKPYAMTRVVWAIEPFVDNPSLQRKMAKVLRTLTRGRSIAIDPVYVHSPEILNLPSHPSPGGELDFRDLAEREVLDFLDGLRLPGLLAPTFLIQDKVTVKSGVECLLNHVRATEGSLIVTSTTVKKGLDWLLLGSFSETLLLQSDTPVLIVGPNTRIQEQVTQIIFPSDFSPSSGEAFERALALAVLMGAKLTFFHKVKSERSFTIPYYPGFEFAVAEVKQAREQAEGWKFMARDYCVDVEVVIDETSPDVVTGILALAETLPSGIIAMATHKDSVVASLLGSVTRKVLRRAPCAVWAIHTPFTGQVR